MFNTIGEKEDLWNLAYVKLCRPLPELAQHSHPTEHLHLQIPCGIIHQLWSAIALRNFLHFTDSYIVTKCFCSRETRLHTENRTTIGSSN